MSEFPRASIGNSNHFSLVKSVNFCEWGLTWIHAAIANWRDVISLVDKTYGQSIEIASRQGDHISTNNSSQMIIDMDDTWFFLNALTLGGYHEGENFYIWNFLKPLRVSSAVGKWI